MILLAVLPSPFARGSPAEEDPAGEVSLDPARIIGGIADFAWKDRPEWGDMMVAILKGEVFQREKGWWHPAGRSLGWPWLAKRFDPDSDGRIERSEFPFEDLLFERLDRDRDGAISARDFEEPAEGSFPGLSEVFSRLDRDSNGRITLEEMREFFKEADSGGLGFLSREDIRRSLFLSGEEAGGREEMPSPWVMLYMLFSRQLGSLTEGPRLGEPAPDFRLPTQDGKRVISLSDSRGKRPVVLIFGSFT